MFVNFQNMCLDTYKLDPARFVTASGLARQAFFRKGNIKLDLLSDINMLLMIEKGIRDGL